MKIWPMLLAAAAFLHSIPARAELDINGFLNVVGGYATERKIDQYEQEEVIFEPDTSFGLQISSTLSDKTSVTGQLISRGNNDFQVEAAWAYMTYQLSDTSRFRAGRLRTPLFLYSEYLDVGYAQHWISPPHEVYALQFDSVNGLEFKQQLNLGPIDADIQVYGGSANGTFKNENNSDELVLRLREQFGIAGNLRYQWLTLRASFHQVTNLTIENFSDIPLPLPLGSIAGLQAALNTVNQQVELGQNGQYILNNLDVDGVAGEFTEAAFKMDWQHFFIVGEGTLLTFDHGPLAEQRRHFLSMGARAGDITYYMTYARANDKQVNLGARLPSIPGVTDGLKSALDGLTSSLMLLSESTHVGIRYDFEQGAAFKFEISENQVPNTEDAYLIRLAYNLVF